MSDPIYTLTSTTKGHKSRCWGWYPDLASAQEAASLNLGGLDESLYDWLVIERVPPGVLMTAEVVEWWEWDERVQVWHRWSSPPPWTAGTVNWGIG